MVEKENPGVFSVQTRNNFILDLGLLVSGLLSVLSGIYFLFLPVGFQGGRNPLYGVIILFSRSAWSDIHTWSSVIIIALAGLHIPLHWSWIQKMTRRGFRSVIGRSNLNRRSKFNLGINILIGLSGVVCALSGAYFLFFPGVETLLFTPYMWDIIHAWSGVVMTSAAVLHFAIHWKWVTKVFGKYWRELLETASQASTRRVFGKVPVGIEDK